MKKTLVLYESKYGFTKMLAEQITLILGPGNWISIQELNDANKQYDFIVICATIFGGRLDDKLLNIVTQNAEWLKEKEVVLLGTCLSGGQHEQYLNPLVDLLEGKVLCCLAIPGDCNYFYGEEFINSILAVKEMKDQPIKAINQESLLLLCEDFLKKHNTCCLSTGHGTRVRATPVEYIYWNGFLYVLSEGGQKFANLLQNPQVSCGVYKEYRSRKELGGMQISGTAEFVKIGSEEYKSVLLARKLNYETIKSVPIIMNMIKIRVHKIEFIWSDFEGKDYDVKQILYVKQNNGCCHNS